MTLPSVALQISLVRQAGRKRSLAVFAVVEDGDSVAELGEVSELVRAHLEPVISAWQRALRTCTHFAASQLVLRCVGLCTVPNWVSYVALSEWMSSGSSTARQ